MFKSNESFAMEIQLTLSQKIVETGLSKFTDSVFCSQRSLWTWMLFEGRLTSY